MPLGNCGQKLADFTMDDSEELHVWRLFHEFGVLDTVDQMFGGETGKTRPNPLTKSLQRGEGLSWRTVLLLRSTVQDFPSCFKVKLSVPCA